MEYGCVGLSEEDAVSKYGNDNIEVYHSHFQALEHALPKRDQNKCYVKLICLKTENVSYLFKSLFSTFTKSKISLYDL